MPAQQTAPPCRRATWCQRSGLCSCLVHWAAAINSTITGTPSIHVSHYQPNAMLSAVSLQSHVWQFTQQREQHDNVHNNERWSNNAHNFCCFLTVKGAATKFCLGGDRFMTPKPTYTQYPFSPRISATLLWKCLTINFFTCVKKKVAEIS